MILYLVLPCYKEQAVLPETATRLKQKMQTLMDYGKISEDSKILFVNDGSTDNTWQIIWNLHEQDPLFSGVNLARNRGHQNALIAGLMVAKDHADVVISMDADLQDDINAIDEMLEKFKCGNDIVYGVRSKRTTDTRFKRATAEAFYKLLKQLGVDIVFNHADYRLMSKRALEGLDEFTEYNLFLRGLVPMIGYKSSTVEYERAERFAGETKYPLRKMLSFALEGITSLSVKPIRMIAATGFASFFFGFIMLIYFLISYFAGDIEVGWPSLFVSIWAIGGLQLLSIGVIGEYIGKIYIEVKGRPRYIIESTLIRNGKTS